ncbi:hypothetical protein SFC76_03100 [Sphingomonas sp. CD22]|uniref:hypothetical protein n=1 Tax=Sphingomonas sp. CD22 TaxID=3100214 RepID=UPI002AE09877|nr:hypothetical protein [Sphingomonas sp. CD22]MEA1083236.1 hypothetical protein [Sphingomonas sp. CD22]
MMWPALAAAWLSICGVAALGHSTLLNRRPRYDRPSHRQPDGLRRASKISPVHGAQYDR